MNRRWILMFGLLTILGCTGDRPADIGVRDGRLAPCPGSPNCVSSFETREDHAIAPLEGSLDDVRNAIRQMPRSNIIHEADGYLYAEFTSRLMRYVDDVEFLADPENNLIHVRSASRLGHSDLGVNRKRVEEIRRLISLM